MKTSPLIAAAGVGWGANFHRNLPDAWVDAVRYCIALGLDPNAKDINGYTAVHGAAYRGDNEMIIYLVSRGARVDAVARNGNTVADMANGARQRVQPYPETIALLEALGARINYRCVSC